MAKLGYCELTPEAFFMLVKANTDIAKDAKLVRIGVKRDDLVANCDKGTVIVVFQSDKCVEVPEGSKIPRCEIEWR